MRSRRKERRLILVLAALGIVCVLRMAFAIENQRQQINALENELDAYKTKYEIIVNDPLYKKLMETGG